MSQIAGHLSLPREELSEEWGGIFWEELFNSPLSSFLVSSDWKWRRKWQPTSVFLPGESQGQWSLVGCRLRGRTELDTTK